MQTVRDLLPEMHQWMLDYGKKFHGEDESVQEAVRIKEKHTAYVTANARELAKHLQLSASDADLAEAIGLFHDVGRFRQFTLYHTFVDAESMDHADIAMEVLDGLPFMQEMPSEDLRVLRFAIRNHNKREIAGDGDERQMLFARIIRDADKLDIYRVLAPMISPSGEADKGPQFSLHTLDSGAGFSQDFLDRFVRGEQCDYCLIQTQDDRKLVRLMWVYDVNYAWTLQRIVERGYVDLLIQNLPQGEKVEQGVLRLKAYIEEKLATPDVAK